MNNAYAKIVARAPLALGLAGLLIAPVSVSGSEPAEVKHASGVQESASINEEAEWREEYAYVLGMQAYLFGYPALHYVRLRHDMIEKPSGAIHMPLNAFYHAPALIDHTAQYGGSPNRDTIYSFAWFDVAQEPLVLETPQYTGRYAHVQLADFYSDVFAYVGATSAEESAETVLIASEVWNDELPSGIDRVIRAPTNEGFVVVRVAVKEGEEPGAVKGLQQGHQLAPLSIWEGDAELVPQQDVLDPAPMSDPIGDFRTISEALEINPPQDDEQAIVRWFGQIGIGPEATISLEELDPATRAGLVRAQSEGRKLVQAAADAGGKTVQVGTWFYGDRDWGRMALSGDYLGRGTPQAFSGVVEHWTEISTKLRTFIDADGVPLRGDRRYELTFPAGSLPEAEDFWSITLYDQRYNLVDNPIGRYSISDTTPDLRYNADGSLTIYIQPDAPSGEQRSNWLPSVDGEKFNLFFRFYGPSAEVIEQTYTPPPVRAVEE